MRGEVVDLPVPLKGLMLDKPPQLVPRDGLLDGNNVFIDLDGLLKPRFGYFPYLGQRSLGIGPIIGLLWWRDTMGGNQYLAVGPTGISALINNLWQTVGTGLHGTVNDPAGIVAYFQNQVMNVVVANNHDVLQQWTPGQSKAAPLTPVVATHNQGANLYTGNTLLPIPPVVNPLRYPQNTQFFFTVDIPNTGASMLGFNFDAQLPVKKLVNGQLADVAANDLFPNVIYNVTYNHQFLSWQIGTNITAPIARDVASVAGRLVAINIVSDAVLNSPRLIGVTVDPTTFYRNIVQVTWTTAFDYTVWPALAFVDLVDSDDELIAIRNLGSFAAVIYGRQSAWLAQAIPGTQDPQAFQFSPIQGVVTGPCSRSAVVVAEGLHYFMSTDFQVWACDGSSQWHISKPIDAFLQNDVNTALQTQIHAVYYPVLRQIWFFYPSLSAGLNGPSRAVVYSLDRGVWEPPQTFGEVFRSSCQAAHPDETLVNFLGGDSGFVLDFNRTINSDGINLNSIPYFFVPGLITAGPKKDLLPSSIDIYLKGQPPIEGLFPELAQLDIFSMAYPFDTPKPWTSIPFLLSDPDSFQLPQFFPVRQPSATAFPSNYLTYGRFFRFNYSGTTINRLFAFGGGTLFVQGQDRGSINKNPTTVS